MIKDKDQILSEYKDDVQEYMWELQVRIFSLVPTLLFLHLTKLTVIGYNASRS